MYWLSCAKSEIVRLEFIGETCEEKDTKSILIRGTENRWKSSFALSLFKHDLSNDGNFCVIVIWHFTKKVCTILVEI